MPTQTPLTEMDPEGQLLPDVVELEDVVEFEELMGSEEEVAATPEAVAVLLELGLHTRPRLLYLTLGELARLDGDRTWCLRCLRTAAVPA